MLELDLVVGLLVLEKIPHTIFWENTKPIKWHVAAFHGEHGDKQIKLYSIYDTVDFIRSISAELIRR